MKTDDELRRELDGNVVVLKPKAEKAPDGAPQERRLATVWADAIRLELDRPGLVDGLLSTTAMTVLYGESGSGKTFVALDLACHVAAGLPWRGMDVEQGVVVYVAAEAPESVQRRVWAWKRHHGVEHLPLVIVTSSVDLLNGDAEAVLELIRELRERHGRIALVVIDTLARAMTGNENAPEDMGRFVAACGRIREACEGHVLVVHHCGKDQARGARGHSSLRAATDVELEVTNGEDGGCVRVTKHRDEAGGRSYGFRLETVELGTNSKGRVVTTCVAAEAEPPERATGRDKRQLGPNERIVLEALAAALVDHGADPPLAPDIPRQVKVTSLERWRDAALRYLPQETAKKKNQAFGRAVVSLVADGRVKHAADAYWLPASGVHQGHRVTSGHMQASCDRPETGVHRQGHAVTPPFRGVTRVTVDTSGGQPPAQGGEERRAAAARMLESGASLRSVAAALGVSKSAVAKWRDGVHPLPNGGHPSGHPEVDSGQPGGGVHQVDSGHPSGHFAPSEDWQEVPDEAVLPPGLHIRVNLETGRKEARRLPS